MPSKAEQVCARIAELLQGTTPVGARVFRDRDDAFTRDESPAIVVEAVDEDTTSLGGPTGPFRPVGEIDQDTLRVAVVIVVRGAAWQQVADSVRVAAHALIAADLPLRGLVATLRRDRCEWRGASADLPLGTCAQIYLVKYPTSAHALDASV